MRIDRSDDGVGRSADADQPEADGTKASLTKAAAADSSEPTVEEPGAEERVIRVVENRAKVDAGYRAHAIDQGYERVREIENSIVTPAMLRIAAEDPSRHLAGLEHRLKGKDRLAEKVEKWMSAQPGLRADQAFSLVKDTIRYTFVYDEVDYTAGVYADCERLKAQGFRLGDRENTWENDQYKGINGRWREPGSGMMFEVQSTPKLASTRRNRPTPPMSVFAIHRRRLTKSGI